ncbi:glycoside hydrolase family 2 protein [Desertibacillus haloalkaliphilus]|uniref:glycoside hydrolase family 2 protein n=1 Tax=Desertibacillus haloalkaliphilus TaxID=1328930 RepID=UPI001C26ABA3|nr:glycoside hydrolase family 2 TIM barrel-domain containing protein [Desertibacillus haloalkaliphilus]MBU8906521.1 glycoside hydrolase family 2 protein [Desertibacillus haloalkaliphilus]
MREIININQGWVFKKEDVAGAEQVVHDTKDWQNVSVPHSWNAVDGANGFEFYKGACWYRRPLDIPELPEGKRIFIEFQGANSLTDVYVNGKHQGHHRGGYSTFRFDITDAIEFGRQNMLAVKVDNTVVDDVYPQVADFTFFGGIYRDVQLVITESIHVDLMDEGSQGVYVVQEEVTEQQADVKVITRLTNENDEDKKVRVWLDILDADGKVVTYNAKEVEVAAYQTEVVEIPFSIDSPVLWNGKENPYLYTSAVRIQSFNDTVDEVEIPFGVRYFEVDAEQGFILNGQPLRLNGVSRHQDRKEKGWAISKEDHIEDMELIKEVGATSIRLAHYQHDQFFYDLCDQEGMVIWAEIPFISVMSKGELEGINAKQQMRELVKQNFNHPSIMFWGVQNEIQIGGERAEVRRLVQELHDLTKSLDPTRLTTQANVMFVENDDPYNRMTDIIGYNKYYGWYTGKAEDFAPFIDGFHKENPDIPLGISEYGAEGIIEYHTDDPQVKDYTEEYHALYHEKVWDIFAERPFLWSTYVWNMFDFGANIRDEGGVQGRNNKGLITYDRKIKKDAFYMYKANWSDEKFVHLTGKRYIERATETTDVKVYTNLPSVTLLVNGNPYQTLSPFNGRVIFKDVPLLTEGNTKLTVVSRYGTETFEDHALVTYVSEPNESYEAPEEKGGVVANWFTMPDDLDDNEEIEEVTITDDVYSTRDTFEVLMDNEETRKVLVHYLGDFSEKPMYDMMKSMKVNMMAEMADDLFTDQMLRRLNRELTKVKKPQAVK